MNFSAAPKKNTSECCVDQRETRGWHDLGQGYTENGAVCGDSKPRMSGLGYPCGHFTVDQRPPITVSRRIASAPPNMPASAWAGRKTRSFRLFRPEVHCDTTG
jgi:hypothetical protein